MSHSESWEEYDKVTQASLNGLYVKAQELDRGHNDNPAPRTSAPGVSPALRADSQSHASTHASDAADARSFASLSAEESADSESHASTHASDR